MISVEVLDNGAIYVDGFRVTNRSTKWGVRQTVDTFRCKRENLHKRLEERGHADAKKKLEGEYA